MNKNKIQEIIKTHLNSRALQVPKINEVIGTDAFIRDSDGEFDKISSALSIDIIEMIKDAYDDGLNAHRTDFCNRDEYFIKKFGNDFRKRK